MGTHGARSRHLRRIELALAMVATIGLAGVHAPVRAASGEGSEGSALSIRGRASAAGVKVGHAVTLVFRAVNGGTQAARNVEVQVTPGIGLRIDAVDAPGAACTTTVLVVCIGDVLDPQRSLRVTIRATTVATGPVETTAAIGSDGMPTDDGSVTVTTRVEPKSSRCDLSGTAGNDRIRGGRRGEVICGRGGNDRVIGRGGKDRLLGQVGEDVLVGGAGRDVLKGGKGRDRLKGGKGRDRLMGGSGRDRCPRTDLRPEARRSCS